MNTMIHVVDCTSYSDLDIRINDSSILVSKFCVRRYTAYFDVTFHILHIADHVLQPRLTHLITVLNVCHGSMKIRGIKHLCTLWDVIYHIKLSSKCWAKHGLADIHSDIRTLEKIIRESNTTGNTLWSKILMVSRKVVRDCDSNHDLKQTPIIIRMACLSLLMLSTDLYVVSNCLKCLGTEIRFISGSFQPYLTQDIVRRVNDINKLWESTDTTLEKTKVCVFDYFPRSSWIGSKTLLYKNQFKRHLEVNLPCRMTLNKQTLGSSLVNYSDEIFDVAVDVALILHKVVETMVTHTTKVVQIKDLDQNLTINQACANIPSFDLYYPDITDPKLCEIHGECKLAVNIHTSKAVTDSIQDTMKIGNDQ